VLPSRFSNLRRGWLTPRLLLWALYDAASSTYIVLVPAILFPVYFQRHVTAGDHLADVWWGLTAAAGLLLAGLLAPIVGVLADRRRWRAACLMATTSICCLTTAVLGAVAALPVTFSAVLFVVGNAAGVLSQSLYDSYVGDVAPPGEIGRVSGFGFGVGFLGGILATVILLAALGSSFERSLAEAYRTAFVIIAALYFLLAAPALVGLRRIDLDSRQPENAIKDRSSVGVRGWSGLARWREHREVFKALLAVFLINNTLVTVAYFIGPYFTTTLGLTMEGLLRLVLVYHLLAAPASYVFGYVSDRWEIRKAILASLTVWAAAAILLAVGRGSIVAIVVVGLFALGFGSTQAQCRALLARLVPPTRTAEFFGFGAVASRLSVAIGPIIFGSISAASGSQRVALFSMLLFLGLGAVVLIGVVVPPTGSSEQAHIAGAHSIS
jgi:UMF1 family MFS transporter